VKWFLVIGIAVVAVIAWSTRGTPTASSVRSASALTGPARLTPEQFAAEVRKNAPLREQLAKQFPDAYSSLSQQSKQGNLSKCIVTKVADGVLKAVCR
jgi:hypothetical protein